MPPLHLFAHGSGDGRVGRELFVDQGLKDVMDRPSRVRVESLYGKVETDVRASARPAFVIDRHGIQ